jgi:hypothetical protein
MKRQLESKQYVLKDFARNCMSLAEYFVNTHQFS